MEPPCVSLLHFSRLHAGSCTCSYAEYVWLDSKLGNDTSKGKVQGKGRELDQVGM